MKKFLITTIVGIATTTAFGAASLRAPQMGGTATVATPTATNTARAGTLRAQTMKTSSVSTPASVTITQSIAAPVSTETTDARIALLKGIKGFNPGKIKDTTAATSELNSLNDRIEELTAQLDRAEAAQSTVLTESNLEAKIEQKLSALGTSTSTKETYSKEEVNNLLTALEKKLPKIDDKGNMTWTDPNGNLVAQSFYWINLVDQNIHWLLSAVQDQGWVQIPIADIFTYHTNKTDTAIQQYVSTTVCSGETSTWCIVTGITPLGDGIKEVKVLRLRHGGGLIASLSEYLGYTSSDYWTFESSPQEYIKNMVCGDMPENECNINNDPNYSHPINFGESYGLSGNQLQLLSIIRVNKVTRYYMDLNWQSDESLSLHQPNMATYLSYKTNMSEEQIEEYVSTVPCHDETPGSGWCLITQLDQSYMYGVPLTYVLVKRLHHGYKHGNIDYITNNNTRVQNFVTIEDNAEEYILDQICGNRPSSECHLLADHQTDCRAISPTPRQICEVYIERSPEPGTGWYLPATPADD